MRSATNEPHAIAGWIAEDCDDDGSSFGNGHVDLASELTTMIESERNYTANSKVFQTGADLMDVLVNLKR